MRRSSWLLIILCAFSCVPLLAHAQSVLAPIINLTGGSCTCPGSAPDWGCVLQTAQTALNDIVAVSTIIITLYIAWAGVDFISSPTNVEGRTKARQRVVNAVLGLLIVLCAWLLVDSFLKVIYNASASATGVAQLGPWNQLLSDTNANDQCIKTVKSTPALPGLTSASNATGGTATAATGGGGATATGSGGAIPSTICTAANAYRGTSTANGPGGGTVSCAWAVNNVLANAGIASIGSTAVSGMESALEGGRGTAVTQASAVCGDIVIQAGDGHVGICLNSGCTQVISNSSSNASFTWISDPTFAPSYSGGVGRFYQVTN